MLRPAPADRSWIIRLCANVFFWVALTCIFVSLANYGMGGKLLKIAFPLLKGLRMWPAFADLRWVTATSQCGVDLQALADLRSFGCDAYGRGPGLGYPPMSIEIARFLGVQGRHTGLIGFAMGVSVIAILISQVRRLVTLPLLRDLFTGLLLFSFPLQLALERSNIDVVVFLLLTSLSAVLASLRLWPLPLAAALAWMLVAIKLYPVVGILAWVGQSLLWRPRFDWLRGATVAGAFGGLTSALPWFISYGKTAAQPSVGLISHGFRVSPLSSSQLSITLPVVYERIYPIAQPLLGLMLFAIAFLISCQSDLSGRWIRILDQVSSGFERRFLQIFPALLGCVWLGCFFFSRNFDYRLIFVFPVVTICFSIWLTMRNDKSRIRLLLDVVLCGLLVAFMGPLLITSSLLQPPFGQIEVLLDYFCDLLVLPLFAGVVASLLIPPLFYR